MRLIDADVLMKEILKKAEENPHESQEIAANHMYEWRAFAHLVSQQPIAYDLDKVIEELEREVTPTDKQTTWVIKALNMILERHIEVIKKGGLE